MDQETPFGLQDKLLGQKDVNLPPSSWRADQDLVHQHDSFSKPLALPPEGRRGNLNGTQYESGLFSSSLPDIFYNKIGLTPKNDVVGRLVEKVNLNHVDDEPFELTKEVEAQIIGDLLPDDDDLLSGVLDDIGYTARANNQDDIDDIFYTGGGMELEADGNSSGGTNNGHTRLNGQMNGEHISGEKPSRILFVRNIDSNVEDSELKFLFEQYGDIHTLNASCKHLGAVMVSYYDVRSAENAMDALQSKLLRRRKLDIHYSLPKDYPLEKYINQGTLVVFNLDPSVTNNDLHRIFGVYGEIKEIHNTSDDCHHKSIEFYDVRAAEAARYALNKSDIAGKQIKLEPSCLGGTKCLTQQLSRELEQGQFGVCNLGSPNSPSACFGSVNMASIKSTGPESGTVQALRSRVHTPIYQFREGQSFLDFPSNTIPSISSPVGIAAAGSQSNHYALDEHSHLPGKMNGKNNGQMDCSFQEISAFHPHSLPEFNNRQSNGVPYNLSTMPAIGFKSNTRAAEAVDGRHIYKGGSGNLSNHSSAHTEALGFSRSGSCHLHGHQLVRSNSFNLHCQPSSPMLWRSTGPFINNIPSRPSMQVHGISRVPSHMIENAIPMNHLHVGSAPAINPPIWDRRHVHATEMMEASGFQPGSAGSMGFPRSPHLHQLEPNSMFPHTGGTFMDPAVSPAHMSAPSQQRGHMFHRRSHMLSSFDSPGERMRCRRNELSASQSDNKRMYELDIERIVRGEDTRTTLMIKNIPNKYTSKMLLAVIDENHKGTYDFIYLPIDFKNKCNVGYAFINMINPEHIVPFYKTFNGKRWEKFNSEKVASLAYARIQGKSALIGHFQNSSLMNEDKRCRPILFHSDGPNAGDQEPFPVGPNVRTRPGRFRISSCEENHRDVLSVHGKGEDPPNKCGDTPGYVTREPGPTSAA